MKPVLRTKIWLSLVILFAGILLAQESFAWVIQGSVYGGSNPLPDTKVTAFNATDQSEVGSSITDDSGNYSITVDNGTYNLLVAPPLASELANSVVNGVVVNNVDVIQNVVIVQQAVQLTGVLRSPVQGVQVSIYEQASETKVGEMLTGSDGAYHFPLAGGTYYIDLFGYRMYGVNFVGSPYYFQLGKFLIDLSVTADTVQDITLPFVFISGQTTDSNGVPVGNVELQTRETWYDWSQSPYAWSSIDHMDGSAKSDAEGHYTMAVWPYGRMTTM